VALQPHPVRGRLRTGARLVARSVVVAGLAGGAWLLSSSAAHAADGDRRTRQADPSVSRPLDAEAGDADPDPEPAGGTAGSGAVAGAVSALLSRVPTATDAGAPSAPRGRPAAGAVTPGTTRAAAPTRTADTRRSDAGASQPPAGATSSAEQVPAAVLPVPLTAGLLPAAGEPGAVLSAVAMIAGGRLPTVLGAAGGPLRSAALAGGPGGRPLDVVGSLLVHAPAAIARTGAGRPGAAPAGTAPGTGPAPQLDGVHAVVPNPVTSAAAASRHGPVGTDVEVRRSDAEAPTAPPD
jgi:hypothetical protein